MKQLFMLLITLVSIKCIAQKQKLFLFDRTDPFTKERTVSYGNAFINEFTQVNVQVKITDSSKVYQIAFMVPYLHIISYDGVDTTSKECKLKIANGQIINGQWINTTSAVILGEAYTSYNYLFSEIDFKTLMTADVIAVKTNQYIYELPTKNQKKVGELIKKVYSKL